jgi:hypothetical protein
MITGQFTTARVGSYRAADPGSVTCAPPIARPLASSPALPSPRGVWRATRRCSDQPDPHSSLGLRGLTVTHPLKCALGYYSEATLSQ